MKKAIVILFSILLWTGTISGQDSEIWKDKRANLDLLNFLDAKMITGYNVESDLSFQVWRGDFPELEVNSPATMNKFMGGDYALDIRWFDTYLQEVDTILGPGRYGYYAEITGAIIIYSQHRDSLRYEYLGSFACIEDLTGTIVIGGHQPNWLW